MALPLNARARVATTAFLLFCASLFLTAHSSRNPEITRYGFMALAELQRPLQLINSNFNSWISGFWEGHINLLDVKEENAALTGRLSELEAQNSTLLEFKHENERLRHLLSLSEATKLKGVAANVIGYDPTVLTKTVIVDKGTIDGVNPEMPVVVGEGIVGQVVAASLKSSRVLLITDPSSAVDALVQGNRVRGLVRGSATGDHCELLYVLREDLLQPKERVIASGMDGIFPKGLLIGEITVVEPKKTGMFQAVQIQPLVNIDKLESVLIVTNGHID